ncbi:MAG: oligosaccharide flippase family protein [Rhodobacteraceae bacterium]|nr:oligosaccharide flippase family protein [Paracoccaceae bacterium]
MHLNAHKVIVSGGIAVASAILALLISMAISRLLGAKGFGVYSIVYVLLMLFSTVLQAGLPRLLIRETSKNLAQKNWNEMRRIWQWSMRVTLFFTLASIVIVAIGIWVFENRLWADFAPTLWVGVLMLPFIVFSALFSSILRGLGHVILGQLPLRILRSGLLVILTGAALFFGLKLSSMEVMTLSLIASVVASVIAGFWLIRRLPTQIRGLCTVSGGDSNWWSSMLLLAMSAGLLQLNTYIDILIIGIFRTSSEVGIYRVAMQTAMLGTLGLQAVCQLVAPSFARVYKEGDVAALQFLARRCARVAVAFALVVAIAAFFWGDVFLATAFGPEFRTGHNVLRILAVSTVLNTYFGAVGVLLNMSGHERKMFQGMVIASVTNAFLCLIMVPIFGIVGGALSTLASVIIWNSFSWFAAWRLIKVDSRAF